MISTILFGSFAIIVAAVFFVRLGSNPYADFDYSFSQTYYPYCQVLILNQEHNYHYEVLESVLALYPLHGTAACNHSEFDFTVAIAFGEAKPFYAQRSLAWYEYAIRHMMQLEYTLLPGQSRFLSDVVRNSTYPDTSGFDYQIRASCYCDNDEDTLWLSESDTHFCLYHESCDKALESGRAVWLHPHAHHQSFFPSMLPQFDHTRKKDPETHHLCIVGEGKRREYDLLAHYLWSNPCFTGLHFHHFGIGSVQTPMKSFSNFVTLHPNPNFTKYQLDLYDTCDAILSLVTRFQHPEYFEGPMKLSGGIVQASAYQKPILLHKDLEFVYKEHLVSAVTHDDDADSFAVAFGQMIHLLDALKREDEVGLLG